MTPEIEREYKHLIEEAEAHFAAQYRWNHPSTYFAFKWLTQLKRIREQEIVTKANRAMSATGGGGR